ncbi:MAG TPA: hypothetical protein PLJ60_02180 [Chryseolinea sp.]|nr:hypothetical protein [Chryseolinea sp.]HPH46224.1 hypothetical protein [Chryseolinea sp.]HPM29118.1 hypothetical protein [Chryseolinea sp.]
MKKQILIIGIILITFGAMLITSSIASAQSASEFVVPLSDPAKRGKLKAHINYGSITVKGTGRKDVLIKYKSVEDDEDDNDRDEDDDRHHKNSNVKVDVKVNVNSNHNNNNEDKSKSKDGLKRIGGGGIDLEVSESSNSVKVQSNSWNHKINLEIEVPSGFDLDVSTYNDGDLIITNIQGQLELTNYNGDITALNISGSVVATSYNGEIKATFDKVTDGTPMSYSTFNGDIDITFPASLKASLKMKTEQGEILTGFDVTVKDTGPVQKKDTKSGVYKVVVDEWKYADVNGGGPEISMKNYNGDIYVRKK